MGEILVPRSDIFHYTGLSHRGPVFDESMDPILECMSLDGTRILGTATGPGQSGGTGPPKDEFRAG